MKYQTYTLAELDTFNREMIAVLDSKQLSPPCALIVTVGLLLSVIRACKSNSAKVPSIALRIEPLLEEALHQGVPVITATPEKLAASTKARAH